VGIAIGVAVPLGTPTPVIESPPDIEINFFNNPLPQNLNPNPGNLPDDGCGTSSGRFDGGRNSIRQVNGRNLTRLNRRKFTQKNGNRIKIKREENWNPKLRNSIRKPTNGCNDTLNFNHFNNNYNCTNNNCTRQRDENAIRKDLENDENWIRIHGTWNFTDSGRYNCTRLGGECRQLLSSGPCRNYSRFWFTLDPVTLKVIHFFDSFLK